MLKAMLKICALLSSLKGSNPLKMAYFKQEQC